MLLNMIFFFGLLTFTFLLSMPIFLRISKNNNPEYSLKKDSWLYLWGLSFAIVSILYFLLPDYNDIIVTVKYINIATIFILSAFIYLAFLLENNTLLHTITIISAAIATYLIPDNVVIFNSYIPLIAERLIIFTVVFLFTSFAKILNGMSAIFTIFILTGLVGTSIISIVGGLPLIFGFTASALSGIWLGFLRFNWYPSELRLTDGACASAVFLLTNFFLYGTFEFSGPSMLILSSYLIAETIWVIVRRYLWHIKEPDLFNNTAYFTSYTRDISIDAILVSIIKIAIVNIIFACFQLYSTNPISIPFFSIIVNLWLLNILYNACEENLSIKETNVAFLQEIKSGLDTIFNRRKK